MESMQEIGMKNVSISYFYRAEEGQRGDGRWPPQARDTGRGMRSRVEGNRRPPERSEGCVCGISPQAEGVRTQSRRHLNAVKVETGRGKGAKRLAGPKLHIDRGGMGGGGSLGFSHKYTDYTTDFQGWRTTYFRNENPNRVGKFHWCLIGRYSDNEEGPFGEIERSNLGWAEQDSDSFFLAGDKLYDPVDLAKTFMHELGHNLDLSHPPHTYTGIGTVPSDAYTSMKQGYTEIVAYHSYEWRAIDLDI